MCWFQVCIVEQIRYIAELYKCKWWYDQHDMMIMQAYKQKKKSSLKK